MSLPDRYNRFAAECERVAQEASDPKDRALLLEMAATWRLLARRAETPDETGRS
jgi:hypothetical protein